MTVKNTVFFIEDEKKHLAHSVTQYLIPFLCDKYMAIPAAEEVIGIT
jgi:hypothetical protein